MNKDLIVARIISGLLRLNINGKRYCLKSPSLENIYISNEIYEETLEEGNEDCPSEQEIISSLIRDKIWSNEKEELLQKIPKDIEDFKVQLFQSMFKSEEKKKIKKLIGSAKDKLMTLYNERHSRDHLSSAYQAALFKSKYLCFSSLYYNGEKVFKDDLDVFWNIASSELIEEVLYKKNEIYITEEEYRLLSRSEPWRSYWSLKKDNLFGKPVVEYTEEQKNICSWSSLYDSVYEHPKCPSDEVIYDDDCLDGWMILQRRERDKQVGNIDFISNEKIKNSKEIFIPADTKEDAKKVFNLNDQNGKASLKAKFNTLNKAGEIAEQDLPETKKQIQMQMNRMEFNARR